MYKLSVFTFKIIFMISMVSKISAIEGHHFENTTPIYNWGDLNCRYGYKYDLLKG